MELQNQVYVTIERSRSQTYESIRQRYPYPLENGSSAQPMRMLRAAHSRIATMLARSDEAEPALLTEPDCVKAGC